VSGSTLPATDSAPHPVIDRLLLALGAAVAAAYLLQLASPLRINSDALRFLGMATSALDGHGLHDGGRFSRYSPGYPLLLYGLGTVGLLRPWAIVAANVLSLTLGAWASWRLAREAFGLSPRTAMAVALSGPLSWVAVRHVTYPMTDIPFFGVSLAALAFLHRRRPVHRGRMVTAIVLTIAAIALRPIGIALVPALLWALRTSGPDAVSSTPRSRLRGLAVIGVAAVILTATAVYTTTTPHFTKWLGRWMTGEAGGLGTILARRLLEMGQLALNVPLSVVPRPTALMAVGAASLAVVLAGAAARARTPVPADVYFAVHTAILLVWQPTDPRFLLPAVPLMAAYAVPALRRLPRFAASAYVLLYVAFGFAALGYSTRISLAGERFPEVYSRHPGVRATYRAAWGEAKCEFPPCVPTVVGRDCCSREAMLLLRRFGAD
jgi:hypothetical protein